MMITIEGKPKRAICLDYTDLLEMGVGKFGLKSYVNCDIRFYKDIDNIIWYSIDGGTAMDSCVEEEDLDNFLISWRYKNV
jgi:hypothetical protein